MHFAVIRTPKYHFNSLLLTFITEVCSEIHCSIVLRFAEPSFMTAIAIQVTRCFMTWDLAVGNLGKD